MKILKVRGKSVTLYPGDKQVVKKHFFMNFRIKLKFGKACQGQTL